MLQTAAALQVSALFQTAHRCHAQALAQLAQGQLRPAAASAWDAARAATNGLLLARTGQEPEDGMAANRLLRQFVRDNPSQRPIVTHCHVLQDFLLLQTGMYDCYTGPEDGLAADIRDVGSYLREVEKLADPTRRPGPPTVGELFRAAANCQAQALEFLEKGPLRAAARKAWAAVWLATDGLILARTGQELADEEKAHTLLCTMGRTEPELADLARRYSSLGGGLFEGCLCDGRCGPPECMAMDLAYAHSYVKDAARLAGE